MFLLCIFHGGGLIDDMGMNGNAYACYMGKLMSITCLFAKVGVPMYTSRYPIKIL